MKRLFKGFILALAALMAAFCLFAACDSNSGNGNENENGGDTAATAISITGAPADLSLDVGEKVTLGYTLSPAGATGSVVWSSSDDTKATVSSSGEVEGVAAGSVIITATVSGTAVSDKVALTVVAPVVANPVTDIAVSAEGLSEGALTMQRGQTVSLTVANTPEDCDAYTLDWTTDKTGVVEVVRTVDGYDLVADGYGTAEVTATVSGTDIADSFTVTVDGDVDDSNGIMTETFARGEIDPEGVYYVDADKVSTATNTIYHGAFFDIGARSNSTTPMAVSLENGALQWTIYTPQYNERVVFYYNGEIDAEESYVVRIPVTSVSATETSLNTNLYYGFRTLPSDSAETGDKGLSYNHTAALASLDSTMKYSTQTTGDVALAGDGGNATKKFSALEETVYLDIRVGSNWNGEVWVGCHGALNTGVTGRLTVSFDNIQIYKASEVVYGADTESFENATSTGSTSKTADADLLSVAASGDAVDVTDTGLKARDLGPNSDAMPSVGNVLRWTTNRIYKEGITAPDGDSHQKIVFTFKNIDASKGYVIRIPVQAVSSTPASETFDIADLKLVAYSADTADADKELYKENTFGYNADSDVIELTIEAGSDWEGVICIRVYNDEITEKANSTKVYMYFDNITINEAVSA